MPTVALAIADHRDLLFCAQLLDRLDLVFGHQVTPRLVEANILGDGLGDFLMIPRDHDHPLDAERMQFGKRIARGGTGRIHQPDRAEFLVALSNDHRSPAAVAQFRDCCSRLLAQRSDAVDTEHLSLADPDRPAVKRGGDAAPNKILEILCLCDRRAAETLAAVTRNRRCERMVAKLLDRNRDPE